MLVLLSLSLSFLSSRIFSLFVTKEEKDLTHDCLKEKSSSLKEITMLMMKKGMQERDREEKAVLTQTECWERTL